MASVHREGAAVLAGLASALILVPGCGDSSGPDANPSGEALPTCDGSQAALGVVGTFSGLCAGAPTVDACAVDNALPCTYVISNPTMSPLYFKAAAEQPQPSAVRPNAGNLAGGTGSRAFTVQVTCEETPQETGTYTVTVSDVSRQHVCQFSTAYDVTVSDP